MANKKHARIKSRVFERKKKCGKNEKFFGKKTLDSEIIASLGENKTMKGKSETRIIL